MNSFKIWSGSFRAKASRYLNKAISQGLVSFDMERCELCGATQKRMQIHSSDYSVELEVSKKLLSGEATQEEISEFLSVHTIVCPRCHMRIHSANKEAAEAYFRSLDCWEKVKADVLEEEPVEAQIH